MSYSHNSTKKNSPDLNKEKDTSRRRNEGRNDYIAKDSPGNSPVSIGDNDFPSPPTKGNKFSQFAGNPHSPIDLFSSPIPKVLVTEAIKIGSGRKVKDPALFVSDGSQSITDNFKGGLVLTPPKKGNLDSPRKENIATSPHKITSEMYSPQQSPGEPKGRYGSKGDEIFTRGGGGGKGYENRSFDQDGSLSLSEIKDPLNETNNPQNKNNYVSKSSFEGSFPRNHYQGGSKNFDFERDVNRGMKDRQKNQPNTFPFPTIPERSHPHSFESKSERTETANWTPAEVTLQDEIFDNDSDHHGDDGRRENVFQKKLIGGGEDQLRYPGQSSSRSRESQKGKEQERNRENNKAEEERQKALGSTSGSENRPRPIETRKFESQLSFGGHDKFSPADTPRMATKSQKISSFEEEEEQEQGISVKSPTQGSRSDIWTPRSAVEIVPNNKGKKTEKVVDKEFASRNEINTLTSVTGFTNKIDFSADPSEKILKVLRTKKDRFIDRIFLPSISSLVNSTKNHRRPEWKALEWLRLPEIYKNCKLTLYDEISPLSIKAGSGQNYDFLSVLAALAEDPEMIKRLIRNQTFNNEGCYSVKICRDGVWRYVLVDDFIPFKKENIRGPHKPFFLQARDYKNIHIWPIIYEKAWAKMLGTYQVLETTSLDQMLRDSTGAPCVSHSCSEIEKVWEQLRKGLDDGNIIVASIKEGQSKLSSEEVYKKGLNSLYGNAVLDISTKSSSGTRIIKLRNIWNEEFSWKSSHKDPQAEDLLQENIILMTLQEFCSIFTHVHICQYNENLFYSQITMRHVPYAYSTAKFSVRKEAEFCFELVQIDHRYYKGDPKYQYSRSRFFIFQIVGGKPQYIGGNVSDSKYNTLRLNLSKGQYYITGIMDWHDDVFDFSFSAYSDEEVEFQRVHYNEKPNIISELFQGYIEEHSAGKTLAKKKDLLKYEKMIEELQIELELFVNNSNNRTLNIRKKITKLENSRVLNMDFTNENQIEFRVGPESSRILIVGGYDLSKDFHYLSEDNASEVESKRQK